MFVTGSTNPPICAKSFLQRVRTRPKADRWLLIATRLYIRLVEAHFKRESISKESIGDRMCSIYLGKRCADGYTFQWI